MLEKIIEWIFVPRHFIIVLVVGAIVGFFVQWAIYGDWRCAFAECRIVK